MRASTALQLYKEQIKTIVYAHHASNVRVFGSVMRGDDHASSDLDLLVDPSAETSLMDIGAIRYELKMLLGIDVDILTPQALPESFRDQVLRDSIPV